MGFSKYLRQSRQPAYMIKVGMHHNQAGNLVNHPGHFPYLLSHNRYNPGYSPFQNNFLFRSGKIYKEMTVSQYPYRFTNVQFPISPDILFASNNRLLMYYDASQKYLLNLFMLGHLAR